MRVLKVRLRRRAWTQTCWPTRSRRSTSRSLMRSSANGIVMIGRRRWKSRSRSYRSGSTRRRKRCSELFKCESSSSRSCKVTLSIHRLLTSRTSQTCGVDKTISRRSRSLLSLAARLHPWAQPRRSKLARTRLHNRLWPTPKASMLRSGKWLSCDACARKLRLQSSNGNSVNRKSKTRLGFAIKWRR